MARKALPDSAAPALPLAGGGGLPFDRERRLLLRGVWPVAGVDEVGRGPLAGPVVAAAVILNPDDVPAGLNDSKQLTRAARERLYDDIMARALHVAAASAPAEEIDATDIRRASLAAMARAVAALGAPPAFVFVDGRDRPALPCETEAVIGGDALVASIAAASIVAKVTRDRMMALLERVCPGYGFGRHMGYASAAHRAAIERLGPSRWHRFSFAPLRQRPDCAAELARRRGAGAGATAAPAPAPAAAAQLALDADQHA